MFKEALNFIAVVAILLVVLSLTLIAATLDGYLQEKKVRHRIEAVNRKQNAYVIQAADYARANYLRDWEEYR